MARILMTKKKKKRGPGPPEGHPGWGGRPRGVEMPCGWGCGKRLTAAEMRPHFTICPKRPKVAEVAAGNGAERAIEGKRRRG